VAVQDGNTPLLLAAKHNPDVKVVQALLAASADVNAKDKVSSPTTQLRGMASLSILHSRTRSLVDCLFGARGCAGRQHAAPRCC
jgi:hypothetical protein